MYKSLGSYTLALECFQKALDIRKEVLGEKHPDVAKCYNNIGTVYDDQGLYTQAQGYYQKALEILKDGNTR